MGIQGLTKLISEKAPGAIREGEMKNYFGRKIAVDASMSIYQFLIAMKGAMGGEGELPGSPLRIRPTLIPLGPGDPTSDRPTMSAVVVQTPFHVAVFCFHTTPVFLFL